MWNWDKSFYEIWFFLRKSLAYFFFNSDSMNAFNSKSLELECNVELRFMTYSLMTKTLRGGQGLWKPGIL